jgi:hypothetical protein
MTRSDGIFAFISSLPGSPGSTAGQNCPSKLCRRRTTFMTIRDPIREQIARVQSIIGERARFDTILEDDPTAPRITNLPQASTVHVRSSTRISAGLVPAAKSEVNRLYANP